MTIAASSTDALDYHLPHRNPKMKQLPKTSNPVVIRTDFENQQAWETICELVRAPVHEGHETFYAYVEFLEISDYQNFTKDQLLAIVPGDYGHSFLFVADRAAVISPEFAILAVDLVASRGRSFRAIPSKIQSIENNLSLANMDFEEFAEIR